MTNSSTHDERIAKMIFGSVYPLYLTKVEKKGRTKAELDQVITWLTGFTHDQLQELIAQKATFESFFNDRLFKFSDERHEVRQRKSRNTTT